MNNKILIIGLLVLAIAVGLVNVFIMPPFMNPDEIQHFMFSANYAYNEKELKELDGKVLQLLKDYKWFHFIGVGPGWERIEKIEEIYFLRNFTREKHSISKSYFHFIYGKILGITGIKDPLTAFYFLRLVSFFVYLGIFLLSFLFYKTYFPGKWIYLITGQLLIFQLATILDSVNYDVLLTLLGVLFFVVSHRFLVSDGKTNLVFLILLSLLAALIKTAGLLFFIYFFILLLIKYRIDPVFFKKFALALAAFVIVFCWFNYWFPGRFFTLYTAVSGKLTALAGSFAGGSGSMFNFHFFDSLLDSFYFHTGWMGFKLTPPLPWYLVLKVFLLLAVVGGIAGLYAKKLKKWHLFALLVIALQVLSTWFYYGYAAMAQGRYLYPVIIPIITLIYCGLNQLEKFFNLKRHYILVSYIIFQAVFLLFALVRVISVFYLEVASPHPGL